MQSQSAMIGVGSGGHLEAFALRDQHDDYEGNLLLAIAKSDAIDYLVTSDKDLLSSKAAPTMSPRGYLGTL